ncbi:MAG: hypothetical protein ACJAYU_001680 [Bradymonadia bacterium]|jgi:hypothetical protein
MMKLLAAVALIGVALGAVLTGGTLRGQIPDTAAGH